MAKTILITKQRQLEALPVKTKNFSIPINAKGVVEIVFDLDAAEALVKTGSFWFHIYEFINNNWRHVIGAEWTGGGNKDPDAKDNNPRLWLDASMLAGKIVRLEVDIPKQQQIGFEISLNN